MTRKGNCYDDTVAENFSNTLKTELVFNDFFKGWKNIKPGTVDLILTDPPYGTLTDIQSWDIMPDIIKMGSIFETLLKPVGQVIMFSNLNLLMKLLTRFTNHFQFRYYMIWIKPGGMPISKMRPINNTELIPVFKKKGTLENELTWNPYEMGERGLPYTKRNYSTDIPTRREKKSPINSNENGWRYPKVTLSAPAKPNMDENERTPHPTQKPEILLRKLIKGFSNPGDTILDPFSGSGTTLVSANKEGRKSIGFELQEEYYKEAEQRINNLTAQEVLF